ARVPGPEGVVGALRPVEEAACAAAVAQLPEELASAPGQELVHVALVGDVEDNGVARRVEHPVQRDCQLHDAEVGADVAPLARRDRDDLVANLLRQPGEVGGGQGLDVGRAPDAVEESGLALAHQPSRSVSNLVKTTPSRSFLSCSILSSASLSRDSQCFSNLLPSSNLANSSASGTSPDSMDSTIASRLDRA